MNLSDNDFVLFGLTERFALDRADEIEVEID